jgi:Na+/melibiose symporter-like transporter
MSIFPAVTFGVCAICLMFYRIGKREEIQITEELAERRKGYAIQGQLPGQAS